MRRTPSQKRSESTVDDISEAAIQLLDTAGVAKFTTNHVAERAGVSIGSLYRYFPDKGAILRHIVRREIKKMRTRALAIIAGSQASDAKTLIDEIVVHSVQNFGGRDAVVFQIRSLIEDDNALLQEIRDAQIEVVQNLHEKMMDIAEKRRSSMSKAALAAAVDAFTTAVQTLAKHSSDKSVDPETRKRLIFSLLTALSEEEPKSQY
ncbi:TetR/AcrR family transcriptional regulator [Thalassococcus lentus]|uniref:TetR/AcrR family transcriptional regulator n=1 Tax=Thalassococcus lentus TaxID=1210524 RepID=A0ABT4XTV8_9RHOB|nr:TetR/AcrR family transcriptional regulator [Thalassococcus lentus]MDA7425392.1 TetR/AcrR family transcriptional regulator [Thalassococcus lentus]